MNTLFSLLVGILVISCSTFAVIELEIYLPTVTSYAVLLDAGSSGTRARILEISSTANISQVPAIEEITNKKIKPGIDSFVDDFDGLKTQLAILLDFCRSEIPKDEQEKTSIYLFATAGMRLVTYDKADDVMDFIRSCLSDASFSPFKHKQSSTRILSGEEEGAFTWMTVNYHNGFFDGNPNYDLLKSIGIVEMGGASSQIAFLADGPILASKFNLKIGGVKYPLYARSHLMYGLQAAREWLYRYLIRNENNLKRSTIQNPCMVQGDEEEYIVNGISYTIIGSHSPLKCYEILQEFVYLAPNYQCYPSPCSIGSAYQPPIDLNMNFLSISGFTYIAKDLGFMDEKHGGIVTGEEMFLAAFDFCHKYAVNDTTRDIPYILKRCGDGLYASIIQTKGYGFSPQYQMQYTNKIKDQGINWIIGAYLYESTN